MLLECIRWGRYPLHVVQMSLRAPRFEPTDFEEAQARAINLHATASIIAVVFEYVRLEVIRTTQPMHQAPHNFVRGTIHRANPVRGYRGDIERAAAVVGKIVWCVEARIQPCA